MTRSPDLSAGLMAGSVDFIFDHLSVPSQQFEEMATHLDISAIERSGDTVFMACDETQGLERLTLGPGGWKDQTHFAIGDILGTLPVWEIDGRSPENESEEIDIEGVAIDGSWLWLTGSHSLKRKRAKPGLSSSENFKRLQKKPVFEENRQFLGCIPLRSAGGSLIPVKKDGKRRAQYLEFCKGGALRKLLKKDKTIAPFLDIPSKENGLDIEGLAVRGRRIWLGLRGPVLRGHAVILEMEMKAHDGKHLKPRKLDGDRRYRTHLIDTAGDGIRDLAVDGEDMLLLVGTAQANDGRSAVIRWRNALERKTSSVVGDDQLSLAAALHYRSIQDNPEGLARWDDNSWIIVHDSPADDRILHDPPQLRADLWNLAE